MKATVRLKTLHLEAILSYGEIVALGETLHESDACRAQVASKVWRSLGICVNMLGTCMV